MNDPNSPNQPIGRFGAGSGAVGISTTTLLDQVLGWLAMSLVITAGGVYFNLVTGTTIPWWAALILMLGLIFAINWSVRSGNQPLGVMLFAVFSLTEGLFLGPVIDIYLKVNPSAVGNSVLGTAGIFVVAATIVFISNRSFASWGRYLMMALVAGIVLIIAGIFIPISQLLIDGFLGVVFVGLTIFDFWRVKAARPGDNNALLIAMSLYLDFINLFLILLRVFGGNRD